MLKYEAASRLSEKTSLEGMQVEFGQLFALSPAEAIVLARRVEELIDERLGLSRQPGQVTYLAISIDEPPGKPLRLCRRVPVHLTLFDDQDGQVWAHDGPVTLRQIRVQRLVYEALMQGGALSQEDLACLMNVSLKTIKRIFAFYREQDQRLPSRGEIQDMGRGVSHKIPIVRKYVQDLSFSRISLELGRHGIASMARYLRHFALVMILEDRDLSPTQMQTVINISPNLIDQYRTLYSVLNVPEYSRTLDRLKRTVIRSPAEIADSQELPDTDPEAGEKGGNS